MTTCLMNRDEVVLCLSVYPPGRCIGGSTRVSTASRAGARARGKPATYRVRVAVALKERAMREQGSILIRIRDKVTLKG